MATHSSVLAWRTPGTEEPGGLQSMGSHLCVHTHAHTLLLMVEAAVVVGSAAVSHRRPHLINEFVWIPSQSWSVNTTTDVSLRVVAIVNYYNVCGL